MNDLEAAKQTEPSLVIIPLDTTFELFRVSPRDAARFIDTLDSLSSQSLHRSIERPPAARPAGNDTAALTAYEKASGEGYVSITRTEEEISILLDTKAGDWLRENQDWAQGCVDGVIQHEGPYGCLRVRGPMPLHLTGIAANFTKTLQNHAIAVFLISTWDTDWIFVKQDKVVETGKALQKDGWIVL